jgi:gamma-glutamyl AIG2-like cyclotransferase
VAGAVREPRVRTFFYGSYMNPAVLAEVQIHPARFEVARLDGYDIRIAPRANLVPSPERCVYGVLAEVTHAELTRLYAHALDVLGETYLPHPVLVQAWGAAPGGWSPALCYLAPSMTPARPDPAYVERILAPARQLGLPEWYLARLRAAGAS